MLISLFEQLVVSMEVFHNTIVNGCLVYQYKGCGIILTVFTSSDKRFSRAEFEELIHLGTIKIIGMSIRDFYSA